jgi:Holliday junction DNA helicase RuvA
MIYSIKGKIQNKGDNFCIVEAGPIGVKILTNNQTVLRVSGEEKFFCKTYIRDDRIEIFGFINEKSLKLFEMLTSVSGIGPKIALNVFDIDTVEKITAAIIEKRDDFLSSVSGIGKKTAGRIILELHNKLSLVNSKELTKTMDIDSDVEGALVNLGYKKREVKEAIASLENKTSDLETRLKEVLKKLSN